MTTAMVTGITGQDGSYLTELLLSKGYTIHGLVRRSSNTVRLRLDHLTKSKLYGERLFLHYADLDDVTTIRRKILEVQPDEFYHLAGQSHVGASFEIPESTCDDTAMGTLRLLEILRDCSPIPKFLHVSSSEVFGRPQTVPQTLQTPFEPVNPYGAAKAFATNLVRIYRDSFGFFACNAICFNHESPRRGESFVTRKITRAAAHIKLGLQNELVLGSLDAQRDWGYAPEFVHAFWLMLQRDAPEDFVLSTGTLHSVKDWLEIAFDEVDLSWEKFVRQDAKYMRSSEPFQLIGDPQNATDRLGWTADTPFEAIVRKMVRSELEAAQSG